MRSFNTAGFNNSKYYYVPYRFSLEQIRDLYNQHTRETGQKFSDQAIEYVFYLTQGEPWLVNALADQACFRDVTDRSQVITKDVIDRAKETLILRRDTHIDTLVDCLKEPRVCEIIDAIISGSDEEHDFENNAVQYLRDLGLITQTGIEIANRMYQEMLPRALIRAAEKSLSQSGDYSLDKAITSFLAASQKNHEDQKRNAKKNIW